MVCLWERDLSYLAIHLDPQRRGILNDLGGKRMKDWQAEAAVLNDFQVKRKETKVSLFLVLPPKRFAWRAVGALTAKYIWIGKPVEPCCWSRGEQDDEEKTEKDRGGTWRLHLVLLCKIYLFHFLPFALRCREYGVPQNVCLLYPVLFVVIVKMIPSFGLDEFFSLGMSLFTNSAVFLTLT